MAGLIVFYNKPPICLFDCKILFGKNDLYICSYNF